MSLLGNGSSSSVYLAEHLKLNQYRAIKCIPKTQTRNASHELEVSLLKNLRHPGIPMIYDVEEDEEYYYIIEEFVQGESLSAFVQSHDNISQETIISVGIRLCEILSYLHTQKPNPVLYLDLKPEHIILYEDQLKLIDFGIAAVLKDEGNQFHSCGTRGFAAPEQYMGCGIGTQTDVFGVGAILYYMLAGEILPPHFFMSKTFPKYCSLNLKKIIKKAVSEKPENRYTQAGELLEELQKSFSSPAAFLWPAHLLKYVIKTGKEGRSIRIRSKKAVKPGVVVGVMGQEAGLGVTHLSIAMANYMAGYLKANVALVEFGERGTLAALFEEADEEVYLDGVTYFPNVLAQDLGYIYNMDFDYVILDLGRDSRSAREELLRCTDKLIVGSLCPWRKKRYYEFIKQIQEHMGNLERFTFLALFEDKIEIKRCRRTFGVRVQHIPYIANPFYVKEKEVPFLHSLF